MTLRFPCKTKECGGTILPLTFKETSGFCMPCFKKQKKQEQEDYIIKNRKFVDQYLGLTNF